MPHCMPITTVNKRQATGDAPKRGGGWEGRDETESGAAGLETDG